jgi:hypothetical protein
MQDPEKLPVVWVFAKWPQPGRVKTRLCPPLSPEQAAVFAMALLEDLTAYLENCPGITWGIAYDPSDAATAYRERYPETPLIAQGEGDLGERMDRIVNEMLASGHPAVLLIGSDVTFFSPCFLLDSLETLRSGAVELLLSPAGDGGYSLIGLTRTCPELFEGIPWSSDKVLPLTLERATALGMKLLQTETLRDCDTPEDYERLSLMYRKDPYGFARQMPHTARFFQNHP